MDNSDTSSDERSLPSIVEEQARAIMQAVPDLVFLLGLDGRYIDIFSARDEDLFIPREALIGKTVSEVLPPPVGSACLDAISQLSGPAVA
jgi:PAS domain-containing protein